MRPWKTLPSSCIFFPEKRRSLSLLRLFQQYGVEVDDIVKANQRKREDSSKDFFIEDKNKIFADQKITIPRQSIFSNLAEKLFNKADLRKGGDVGQYFEGQVEGKGDGMSDEIPFQVEGGNPDFAMLSKDEYVIPADVVAMLGNGSSDAGSDKLDDFLEDTREEAFGRKEQQTKIDAEKGLSSLA